ncbi:acyl-CoA dehydrogenase family protein [Parafrankia sp. EUN1f]|uniref:acyl-CoA dehydrogenase family protein n=1 Tax=Parafrankia sp. EUN1f TaxID=102897 RepID=UPI0001C47172|nr:acyl-CoA dehydrogenase family protein [Parafrankia sp. EUN1f]EFC79598.1 acyl-CoA dehydrogenase domain protein [Parafrankia sp. EUN1f]
MFELSREHDELRATVRKFLARRSEEGTVRRLMETSQGYDEQTWQVMAAQLGLQGLAIPEEHGGSGFGVVELQIVMEEMGRALMCSPFLATVCWAVPLLLESGDAALAAELLPAVAEGSVTVAVAVQDGERATVAQRDDDGWTLDGSKRFVVDGASADRVVVLARTPEGPGLFLVDDAASLVRTAMTTLDQTRKQAALSFEQTRARPVGDVGAGQTVLDAAMVTARTLLAAESVGTCARMLEMTVNYAKIRHQFDRPIGSFQAVKHLCTRMLIDTELATSAAGAAGAAVDAGDDAAPLLSRVAAAATSDALESVAAEMIEIHGGIGFTWEHPAHLYYKRAASSARLWGSSSEHRSAIFDLAGATK